MDTPTSPAAVAPSPAASASPAPVAPAVTPSPAPAAPAAPSKPTTAEILAKASPSDLRALALSRAKVDPKPAAVPAAPAPAPTPAAPAAPAAEATPAATPATTPEGSPPGPDAGGEKTPDRFRFKDEEDQAVALIAKSRGISLVKAADIYRGQQAAATPAAPASPATPAQPEALPEVVAYDNRVTELNDRIKKLTADRTKAREDIEHDKADDLSDKIADATAELRLVENEKKGFIRNHEASQRQEVVNKVNESRDRAYTQFPELAEPRTNLALIGFITQEQRNPDRADFFKSPNWPEKIAAEFAGKFGVKAAGDTPAATPAAPAETPASVMAAAPAAITKPVPAQVTGAKLLTGADGGHPSAPSAMTPDQVKAKMRTDPEFRRAVVRVLGGKPAVPTQ